MASEEITVKLFTCDGCGKQSYSEPDGEMPYGFHGHVMLINSYGGNGDTWYACRPVCIKKAVLNASEGPDR